MPEELEEQEGQLEQEQPEEPKEAAPYKVFNTEEEYNQWVELNKAAWQPKEEEKVETPKEEVRRYFEEDWKPKSWNDFAENLLKNEQFREEIQKGYSGKAKEEINEIIKEQKEMESINKGFDRVYGSLAKEGKVPALESEEGEAVDRSIAAFAYNNGIADYKQAYEEWKKVPMIRGGGLEYTPPATQRLNEQKKRSGLIGGSRGGSSESKKSLNYDDIHRKSLDEIIDDEAQ